jgi:adenosylmethionine-8-amino-7-oxononanoate aminotransferase
MPPLDAPFSARLDASDLSAHWLPFTANRAFKRRPRLIDRAEGMHYYAADGRKLLDAMSGLRCCNAGSTSERSGSPPASTLRRSTARRACAARAFEAAFFEEDLVIRAVGDMLVLAPALIAGESEIGAITEKLRAHPGGAAISRARLGFSAVGCYQEVPADRQFTVALQGPVAA